MATNPSLIGRLLAGRYRIQQRRGMGAHGIVLDAWDEQLDRLVAVKILLPQFASDTASEARFRLEAQVAASCTHPNLNAVFDWGVEEIDGAKVPFIVLEHLGGGSLRDMIDRGRLLTPSQALMMGLDACRGLDYLHRHGVMHRDLKPANLAFGEDRHLRILDVALSRYVAESTWVEPTAAGIDAARYASPEQARGGQPVDGTLTAATDIYSLCLVIIESVTGQVPFASDSTVATLNARINRLMPVSADFGPLAPVLSRAGSADPADRYTAAEFGKALVQAAGKLPRPAPLPIVGFGQLGDTTGGIRRPLDPSGPVERRADPAAPAMAPPVATSAVPGAATPPPPPPPPAGPLPSSDAPPAPWAPAQTRSASAATPALFDVALDDDLGDDLRDDLGDAEPRRSRRRVGWIIAVLVVLAGLGVGAFVVYNAVKHKTSVVPELTGMTEAVGRNQIAENGWTVVVTTERSDAQPLGTIIRTEPVAGTKLGEGLTITFVVSDGPTLATLPDVGGQTLDAATALLASNNLDITIADEVFDEEIPAGTITTWMVPAQPGLAAGAEVMQRTVVAVVVSKGPAPRPVPSLLGMDEATATATLTNLQLGIVRSDDIFSDTYPAGQVADQSLPAGTEIQRGETVTIAISKGVEMVAVPALAGLSYADIKAALGAAGLRVGTITGDKDLGTITEASVDGAAVQPGQVFPHGTKIDLLFS